MIRNASTFKMNLDLVYKKCQLNHGEFTIYHNEYYYTLKLMQIMVLLSKDNRFVVGQSKWWPEAAFHTKRMVGVFKIETQC